MTASENKLMAGVAGLICSRQGETRSQIGIEQILLAAYQASLRPYEGSALRLSVVVSNNVTPDLVFAQRRDMTADSLRDLASAVPHSSHVLVATNEDQPKISGIMETRREWAQSLRNRSAFPFHEQHRNDWDTQVDVVAPGILEVMAGEGWLRWQGGDFTPEKPIGQIPNIARLFGYEELDRRIRAGYGETLNDSEREAWTYGVVREQTLVYLVELMRSGAHGGCVLIVDPRSNWNSVVRKEDFIAASFPLLAETIREQARILPDAADPTLASNPDILASSYFQWQRAVEMLAGLTHHDGAVLVSPDFELIGYGATLPTNLPASVDVLNVDWPRLQVENEGRDWLKNKGTRHRSAVAVCSRVPNAMAAVVSQDGAIAIASADDECHVCVFTGCGTKKLADPESWIPKPE
jgi:hypothetical protein